MNYRVEQGEAFEMFDVYGFVGRDFQEAFTDVPQFRKKCDEDGSVDLMNELLGWFGDTVLHAAFHGPYGEIPQVHGMLPYTEGTRNSGAIYKAVCSSFHMGYFPGGAM